MHRDNILICVAAAVSVFLIIFLGWLIVAGPDDGNTPPSNPSDEYTSDCDRHGNLVYLTEDDTDATPNIFVLEGACPG